MAYKMIFSDIDGTLLDSGHHIGEGTRRAVRALKPQGIPFVLVSARAPYGIVPLQKELRIDGPIVAFGGALVLGAAEPDGSRQALRDLPLAPEETKAIHALVASRFPAISFTAYGADDWFIAADDEWVLQERGITGTPARLFRFAEDEHPAFYKLMCMGEPGEIDSLARETSARFPELTIVKSKPTYLEIMARQVSKSAAMRVLMDDYGVGEQETIAIGDNYNDIDMIRFAGLGVAMGNAPDEVKAAADLVAPSNDEEGVREILERYVL